MDLSAANAYFQTRVHSSAWTQASNADKIAALATAENQINTLPISNFADQGRVTRAIYEQALFLLRMESTETREDLQARGVASVSISGGASETFKNRYGFPIAPMAQSYLSGCLRRTGSVV